MSRNTSVSLGDHFVNFIDSQVREGAMALPVMSCVQDCVF